jgi:flagellar basal-body rod protein FlgC
MISVLPGIESTTSALNAERVRLEVIAQNIANVNTSRGVDGQPYKRQEVVFQSVLSQKTASSGISQEPVQQVQVARIQSDNRAPRLIYSPNHQDANADGYVAMPDINVHEEMADLMTASRSYEANLAVVRNSRTLAQQALSIGKR